MVEREYDLARKIRICSVRQRKLKMLLTFFVPLIPNTAMVKNPAAINITMIRITIMTAKIFEKLS